MCYLSIIIYVYHYFLILPLPISVVTPSISNIAYPDLAIPTNFPLCRMLFNSSSLITTS